MNIFLKASSISSFFLIRYRTILLPVTIIFVITDKTVLLEWSIFDISSCRVSFMFIFDAVRLSFRNVVCFISGCVILFSSSYISSDPFLKRFVWLVILFVLSINLLVFIPSLPALLLG